jgi:hypothetical protein
MNCARCGKHVRVYTTFLGPTHRVVVARGADAHARGALDSSPVRCNKCLDAIATQVDKVADQLVAITLMHLWVQGSKGGTA